MGNPSERPADSKRGNGKPCAFLSQECDATLKNPGRIKRNPRERSIMNRLFFETGVRGGPHG